MANPSRIPAHRKGVELYDVPLAMLTWGQRWVEPADLDTHLTHKRCDSEVQAVLSCASCGEVISRDDIALTSTDA